MDLLKAVNVILPKLGEHPVTSLNGRHSTVALIVDAVQDKVKTICLAGWWFNTYHNAKLVPSSGGEVAVPANMLSFVPKYPDTGAVIRKGKLFNNSTQTYIWTEPQEGSTVSLLEFDELPESAALYAMYSALVDTYVTDLGLGDEVRAWGALSSEAEAQMEAEHLQQMKYSTRRSFRWANIRRAMRA